MYEYSVITTAPAPTYSENEKFLKMADKMELTKTREILYKNETIKSNIYGMVIFTSKPVSDEEKLLYKDICRYWESSLYTKQELAVPADVETFSTYWPSAIKSGSDTLSSCNSLHSYNYAYVTKLVNSLKIKKTGPFLLAVYNDGKKKKYVLLNIGAMSSNEEDIKRAFDIWKYEFLVNKHGWSSTFNIINLREIFRIVLNKYGKQILEFKDS
jgi:hypothetical protein